MDLFSLSVFALALALNSGSPGPSIAALVSRVLARGPGDVLPFLAAMWIGELLWLLAALYGLSHLATGFQGLFLALKYLGVGYLLYLAWKMWHQPVSGDEALPESRSAPGMFLSGMALTLGNPKIMVFYIALLPGFFDLSRFELTDTLLVASVMLGVLAAVDLAWVMLAARARRLIRSPHVARRVNRVSATIMGGAAAVIATR